MEAGIEFARREQLSLPKHVSDEVGKQIQESTRAAASSLHFAFPDAFGTKEEGAGIDAPTSHEMHGGTHAVERVEARQPAESYDVGGGVTNVIRWLATPKTDDVKILPAASEADKKSYVRIPSWKSSKEKCSFQDILQKGSVFFFFLTRLFTAR